MATIVTRASKGEALSHTEMDSNFTNLNTELADKVEKTSEQALSVTDALRIAGDTISLYKGDGTHEDVVLPAVDPIDPDTLYDTAHSFSSNGYQKLSNGLIFQWGNYNNTDDLITVTFPIAFTTACLSVNVSDFRLGITDGIDNYVATISSAPTTTGVSIANEDAYNPSISKTFWFAIGY